MTSVDTIIQHYGRTARTGGDCCGNAGAGAATFSLGTGDVVGAARLRRGEWVLDLGSGTGHDALRAGELVGPEGRVVGIDMTSAMVERARLAATGHDHVTFELGDVARLPYAEASFDVVLTNCVLNLVPDKRAAFAEAKRVLRPDGRLVLSDVVFAGAPAADVRLDEALTCACVGNAALLSEYLVWLRELDLGDIEIVDGRPYGHYGGADALAVTLVARAATSAAQTCC